jgi:hypothetical protein
MRETRGNFSEPSISEQTAVHRCLQLMEFKRWGLPPVFASSPIHLTSLKTLDV